MDDILANSAEQVRRQTSEFELRLQELEGRFKAPDAARVAGAGSTWPYNR